VLDDSFLPPGDAPMPGPYSLDLRQRVLAACDEGKMTRGEISDLYEVGESAIYEWLQRRRTTGSFAPKPHTGGAASELDEAVLSELVEAENDRTLEEYAAAYAERTGRRYSISQICRGLKSVRLRRKKNATSHGAAQSGGGGEARRLSG
jgi:transposase